MSLSLRKEPGGLKNVRTYKSYLFELAKNSCKSDTINVLEGNYAIKIAMKLKDIYDKLQEEGLIQIETKNGLKRPSISTEIEGIMSICSYNINYNNINGLIESFNTNLEELFLKNETLITEIFKLDGNDDKDKLVEKILELSKKISIDLFNLKLSQTN